MGTATAAGGNAKETGFSWWFSPNTGATNAFGFNLRGGAGRVYDGTFYSLKGVSYIHAYYDGYVIRWNASSTSAYMGNDFLTADASNKKLGYGVRVVRISSTLTTQGQTGTYTGNDGKIYRTIAIGTGANLREIVADNLAETKFRDGSLIPKVTTNAAWAALVTAGYCAYENVETNALP